MTVSPRREHMEATSVSFQSMRVSKFGNNGFLLIAVVHTEDMKEFEAP